MVTWIWLTTFQHENQLYPPSHAPWYSRFVGNVVDFYPIVVNITSPMSIIVYVHLLVAMKISHILHGVAVRRAAPYCFHKWETVQLPRLNGSAQYGGENSFSTRGSADFWLNKQTALICNETRAGFYPAQPAPMTHSHTNSWNPPRCSLIATASSS